MNKLEKKLNDIQQHYEQLHNDIQALQELNQRLPDIRQRMSELLSYYQNDWMLDVEKIEQQPDLARRIDESVTEGHYSVLGQDTIWNLLDDAQRESKEMIKHLVDLLQ